MYQETLNDLIAKKTILKKGIHKDYTTVDQVKRGIKSLNQKIETQTLNKAEEMQLKKDLALVEKSKPQIE